VGQPHSSRRSARPARHRLHFLAAQNDTVRIPLTSGVLRGRGILISAVTLAKDENSGELAVSEDHFIVAARVTQQAADTASLLPMIEEVERRCRQRPQQVLADSGFHSGANLDELKARGIDGYVADTNLAAALKCGGAIRQGNRQVRHRETLRMREKLRTPAGRRTYLHRKAMVEPVIGTLKQQRGLRQFLRRGLRQVQTEWLLAALGYNLTRSHRLLR